MRVFSLTLLDFGSTQILQFMTCNDSSGLQWSSTLSTTTCTQMYVVTSQSISQVTICCFLKLWQIYHSSHSEEVEEPENMVALNCFHFLPIQEIHSVKN